MAFPLALLGGAALSPLQGLGFGFGYGYGVRLGYHSFKPSENDTITNMRLSPNPLTAGTGMGLASAEEMHGEKLPLEGMTTNPTPTVNPNDPKKERYYDSKSGKFSMTKPQIFAKGAKHGLSPRESFKKFVNEEYPFVSLYSKKTLNRRY